MLDALAIYVDRENKKTPAIRLENIKKKVEMQQ